jgi:hypothetical protein
MRSPIIDELTKKKQIWIGTQYWTDRRLILSESTYGNEPSDTLGFAKHFETDEDFLFRTIYNSVTGTEGENPGRFQEQRRAFSGQFGFYNLVFESLGKKYRKCMPQDFELITNPILKLSCNTTRHMRSGF